MGAGREYGNESGKTTRWANENAAAWLKKLNPEAVVLMFGTNDLAQIDAKEYETATRAPRRTVPEKRVAAMNCSSPSFAFA